MKKSVTEKLKRILKSGPSIIAILVIFFLIIISRNSLRLNDISANSSGKVFFQNEKTGPAGIIGRSGEIRLPGTNYSLVGGMVQKDTRTAPAEDESAEENQNAGTSQDAGENTNEAAEPAPPPAPRADLIIGVVADAHASQGNGWQKLSTFAWRMGNYENPDVIVDLGDLIESRKNYNNISKKEAEVDYRKARSIISRYPVYNVFGNHELLSMRKDNVKNITGRSNYYSVNIKGYNIIVLDSNYTDSGRTIDADNSDKFIYTGMMTGKEKDWLEKKLENNDKNIIFIHHPLYNLTNNDKVEDIIRDNKKRILLIVDGHKHPSSLRVTTFGGVKNYDIPSLNFNKQYAMIKINGSVAAVISKKN